jgi:hypothetical protein
MLACPKARASSTFKLMNRQQVSVSRFSDLARALQDKQTALPGLAFAIT